MSTGTPQGGMISPLDWNLVADELLRLLNGGGCYAKSNVDEFDTVTGSSDLGATVNHMQLMLKKVTTWYNETKV